MIKDELNNALLSAAANGEMSKFVDMVNSGVDMHTKKDLYFIYAVRSGNLELVKYLVENQADIHYANEKALITATSMNHLSIVKYLIEEGADLHEQTDLALLNAIKSKNLEMVEYLIEKGADIYTGNNMPLISASLHADLPILKLLIKSGASVDALKDNLLRAVTTNKKCFEIVKYLIVEHDCDPEIAIKEATENGRSSVVEWCKSYMGSKKLNSSLEKDLKKTNQKIIKHKV